MRTAVKRVALEVIGWTLVVAGIAGLILPGPGLLMLFAGLALLSQQYDWAERRVEPIKVRALKAARDGVETWPRIVLSTLGALWLVALGVMWGFRRPGAPEWWPVDERWWLPGGLATGITLIASGFIAGGLIVYSFRTYRERR